MVVSSSELYCSFLVLVILDARTHSLPRNVTDYHYYQDYHQRVNLLRLSQSITYYQT